MKKRGYKGKYEIEEDRILEGRRSKRVRRKKI
jgi:hypothetical protein